MIPKNILNGLIGKELGFGFPVYKNYKGVEFSKKNFNLINKGVSREVFAFDGGCATIADGGSWLISKVKVGVVCYNGFVKSFEEIKEFFVKIVDKKNFEINVFNKEGVELSFSFSDFNNFEINEITPKIMKVIELSFINDFCKENSDKIILIDGGLEGDNDEEINLLKKIKGSNNIVVGVCKTSRLKSSTGRSVLGVVNSLSNGLDCWFYYPLFKDEDFCWSFISKLHRLSKFVYKIQLFDLKNVDLIFKVLRFYSNDSTIVGYPYPLVKADKIARVSDFEQKKEKNFFNRVVKNNDLEYDLRSSSFHSEIDKRKYK